MTEKFAVREIFQVLMNYLLGDHYALMKDHCPTRNAQVIPSGHRLGSIRELLRTFSFAYFV